jgi:hypothetical protein
MTANACVPLLGIYSSLLLAGVSARLARSGPRCASRTRIAGSIAACLGLLSTSAAHAEPEASAELRGLGLNWVRLAGAEQCIASAELMNRVETLAGRILFVRSGEAALSIDGYVLPVAEPKGWAVKLALSTAQGVVLGTRDLGVLPGADCHVIDQAVELLIHVTLDADGTLDAGIPLSATTRRVIDDAVGSEPIDPDPTLLPVAVRAAAPPARTAAAAATRLAAAPSNPAAAGSPTGGVLFDLAGASGLGQLPGLGLGAALHAALIAQGGWLLEVGFGAWPKRMLADRAGFELQMGSLSVCPWQLFSMLALCVGAEYGSMTVVPGASLKHAVASSRAVFDLVGSSVLRIRLGTQFFVRGALGLAVPLLVNDYEYTAFSGTQRVFRMSPVAGRLEVGFGMRL